MILTASFTGCFSYLSFTNRKSGNLNRGRSLFYALPKNFYPYSRIVLEEIGYKEKMELKLQKGCNIDVSKIDFKIINSNSFIISLTDKRNSKEIVYHYLVNGINSEKPEYIKKVFNGTIFVVNENIFGIENSASGFLFHKMDRNLEIIDSKTINFYKISKLEQNLLNYSSSGLYKLNDNVTSYIIYYPYILFYSINLKTDKYYEYMNYKSENVISNTIQMNILNIETFESVKISESEIQFTGKKNQVMKPSTPFSNIALFEPVMDSSYFVFSAVNWKNEYAHAYFENISESSQKLQFDDALSIVNLFPELSLIEAPEYSDSEKIMANAVENSSGIMIDGINFLPYSYSKTGTNGYLIFARYVDKSEYASVMIYADEALEEIYWKKDFRKIVSNGYFDPQSGVVNFYDLDESNRGFNALKHLESEEEARILPVNLYQYHNSVSSDVLIMNDLLILYDDSRSSVKFFTK